MKADVGVAVAAAAGARYPWELPLGARPLGDGTCEFRVWAPRARSVTLRLAAAGVDLALADAGGYGIYEVVADCAPGEDYVIVIDGLALPDPCSRWQPAGLRGPSRVVDPGVWGGAGDAFAARALGELVLYELHVGTFSPEGTFDGAIPYLRELADLGVGAIEIMPVAEFPGARGWGYDGVYLSAAQSSYGGPSGLARLVRAAHECGLAVILDVVYNHLGTSGVKALEAFGPYFTERYETPWGRAINYDGADCDAVREFVCQSAVGWIRDFGIDGLRLDAVHAIFDSSPEHIVAAIARRVHEAAPDAVVIAESGLNDPRVVRPRVRGGHDFDAVWADDFHHSLRVLLTGYREGYYAEFGRVEQLAKAFRRPYVFDGGYSSFRRRRFGAPAEDVGVEKFVVFAQNHDQVGNRAYGDRLPPATRPLAAFCTLLAPYVPLLFMGEEYGEAAPFQFFSDHIDEEIAVATREGRRREFAAFAQFGHEIPDPQAVKTFLASKLTRAADPALARLYRDLIAVRRSLPTGDASGVAFDEEARWLRVTRGAFELACNFSSGVARVPCAGAAVRLATHDGVTVVEGGVELPSLAGALLTGK
jgi:maltooligosyltrehalose trehalohydrolase